MQALLCWAASPRMAEHWDIAHSRSHSPLKGTLPTQTTPTWALSSVYAPSRTEQNPVPILPSIPSLLVPLALHWCSESRAVWGRVSRKHNCVASNGSSESSAQIVDLFDFSQDTMKSEGQEESGAMGFSSEMSYLNPGICLVKSG